jgi:hypothetical protein
MSPLEEMFVMLGDELIKFKAAMDAVDEQLKATAREANAASAGWSEAFDQMQSIAGRMTDEITCLL